MRKPLEDLYCGNITLGKQEMGPNSELRRAMNWGAHYESQLTERFDENVQQFLQNSLGRSMRSTASPHWETSFLDSGWEQVDCRVHG